MKGIRGGLVPERGNDGVWREQGRAERTPIPVHELPRADVRRIADRIRARVRAR